MVIFALVLTVLLLFVGLALDAGSLYVAYGHLKRSVDSAAVAAANQFKKNDPSESLSERKLKMDSAAIEAMQMQGIDVRSGYANVNVYICDSDGDGVRDSSLETTNKLFYDTCPNTASGASARKLVWVQATQYAPLYFLQLIGVQSVPLTTYSIAEAAPLDLVLVIDTSESMGNATVGYTNGNFDPSACNSYNDTHPSDSSSSCRPLWDTKKAAKDFIDTLYEGYDQVGIVTFDQFAVAQTAGGFVGDLTTAKQAVDNIHLHDDAPWTKLRGNGSWISNPNNSLYGAYGDLFNPANPEDWDNDGQDVDNFATGWGLNYGANFSGGQGCPDISDAGPYTTLNVYKYRWWSEMVGGVNYPTAWGPSSTNFGGAPCDVGSVYDSFDWNSDGVYDSDASTGDDAQIRQWLIDKAIPGLGSAIQGKLGLTGATQDALKSDTNMHNAAAHLLAPVSTCTGCGIRVASDFFKQYGRQNSVWVMVFLSDGMANVSDLPATNPTFFTRTDASGNTNDIKDYFPNGFCYDRAGGPLRYQYGVWCLDPNPPTPKKSSSTRYCVDPDQETCPPSQTTAPVSTTVWLSKSDLLNPVNRNKYGPYQYAMDMVDQAALTSSSNTKEPAGNKIAIYTIAFGSFATVEIGPSGSQYAYGEELLRYMAAVGDDGDRNTDPCRGEAMGKSCGNYYNAPTIDELPRVFADIARRIQTRISY